MKRLYGAALMVGLVVAQPAFCQTSVDLYGIVDTGVEFLTHGSPTGGSIARMPVITGGDLPSRWGLRGQEDLGGGAKAIFTLESGIDSGTGGSLQNGRLFGRQAFVGLSNRWGSITLGRQNTMTLEGMAEADVIGPAAFALGTFDSYLPSARADNSIAYKGTFANLTLGIMYSFGRDTQSAGNCGGQVPGNQLACRALSAMIKYDSARWGAAAIYDEQRGGAGAAAISVVPGVAGVAFANPADTDRRYQINGYFYINRARIAGGWIHRQLDGDVRDVRTDLVYLGVSVPVNAWIFDAQISHIDDPSYQANGTLGVVRANYYLSKRTSIYGLLAYMKNSGNGAVYSVSDTALEPSIPEAGVGQAGVMLGVQHLF